MEKTDWEVENVCKSFNIIDQNDHQTSTLVASKNKHKDKGDKIINLF